MIKWVTLIEYKQDLDSSIRDPCMFNSQLSWYQQKAYKIQDELGSLPVADPNAVH